MHLSTCLLSLKRGGSRLGVWRSLETFLNFWVRHGTAFTTQAHASAVQIVREGSSAPLLVPMGGLPPYWYGRTKCPNKWKTCRRMVWKSLQDSHNRRTRGGHQCRKRKGCRSVGCSPVFLDDEAHRYRCPHRVDIEFDHGQVCLVWFLLVPFCSGSSSTVMASGAMVTATGATEAEKATGSRQEAWQKQRSLISALPVGCSPFCRSARSVGLRVLSVCLPACLPACVSACLPVCLPTASTRDLFAVVLLLYPHSS